MKSIHILRLQESRPIEIMLHLSSVHVKNTVKLSFTYWAFSSIEGLQICYHVVILHRRISRAHKPGKLKNLTYYPLCCVGARLCNNRANGNKHHMCSYVCRCRTMRARENANISDVQTITYLKNRNCQELKQGKQKKLTMQVLAQCVCLFNLMHLFQQSKS